MFSGNNTIKIRLERRISNGTKAMPFFWNGDENVRWVERRRERQRQRERERETDRQTDRQTETERYGERERCNFAG